MQGRRIVFLDIDGILNCQSAYERGVCKYTQWEDKSLGHYQTFDPVAKGFLNKLIKQTNADIVISSTWRHNGINHMKNVWKNENMEGNIIGITPDFRGDVAGYTIPRGCEIDAWLRAEGFSHINWSIDIQKEWMKKSNIANYIIIDDDSDMLYGQRNHFVHVLPSPRNMDGFCEKYFKEALTKLYETVVTLNYKND